MSNRGRDKPKEASRSYTIWGTELVDFETLNDPTRRRKANPSAARYTKIAQDIEDSMRRKLGPMKRIKA